MKVNAIFTKLAASCLVATLAAGCSCSDSRKPTTRNMNEVAAVGALPSANAQNVKTASVTLKGLSDSKIQGKVTFTQQSNGVLIVADVDGLTPGKHGFHIHEFGDCSAADGSSAGEHYNPTKKKHGGPDSPERHVGDLGNLEADAKGHAHYERVDRVISLNGKDTIVGRSVIVHSNPDDFKTQPSGASGAKLACGVIEADTAQ